MAPLLCPPYQEKGESTQCMSSTLKANFEVLKKRKLDEESARRVAEETAHLVESEIQQMRNSVAELEALLAAKECADENEDDSTADDHDEEAEEMKEKNQFPILPPDVVAIPSGEDEYLSDEEVDLGGFVDGQNDPA